MDQRTENIKVPPRPPGTAAHPDVAVGMGGRLWRGLGAAAALLTIVPIPASVASTSAASEESQAGFLAGAAPLFPVVGAAIGGLAALLLLAADGLGLGLAIAACVGVGAAILVTGALHEDGLADFADGVGGGWTRAERLSIMHDSRIGSFGVLALVFSVGLRIAAVVTLADAVAAGLALIAAAAISRAALPAIMATTPVARADGAAASAGGVGVADAVIAGVLAAAVAAVCLSPLAAALALVAAAAAAAVVRGLAVRAVGGYTGDGLGAAQQVAEAAVLIAVVAVAAPG